MSNLEKPAFAFFEDKIVPIEEANINIRTHALQYGTACLGGIRGYWNKESKKLYLFKLEDHYKRLIQSAHILMMKTKYSVQELIDITIRLTRKHSFEQGIYIRPFLYKSDLSLSPRLHNVKNKIAIYIIPLANYLDINNGLRCKISSWTRITDNMIPTRAKTSGGYINSALAKSEALIDGYDEAIFLDKIGNVSEGSAENIFIVKNSEVITPPLSASILEGITRRTLIEVANKELNITVKERNINRTELYTADEVFFCGTGVQLAWIKEIDNRTIGTTSIGPITKRLQDIYFSIVIGNTEKYKEWLTEI